MIKKYFRLIRSLFIGGKLLNASMLGVPQIIMLKDIFNYAKVLFFHFLLTFFSQHIQVWMMKIMTLLHFMRCSMTN